MRKMQYKLFKCANCGCYDVFPLDIKIEGKRCRRCNGGPIQPACIGTLEECAKLVKCENSRKGV